MDTIFDLDHPAIVGVVTGTQKPKSEPGKLYVPATIDGNLAMADVDAREGEKHAYDFVNGRSAGLKLLYLDGPYYCCEVGCHLDNPMLHRDGKIFGICGDDPDGVPVPRLLNRTQVLCLFSRDKQGKCTCNKGSER